MRRAFRHVPPRAYLLEHHLELRSQIDDATIERAASMFDRVNSLLSTNGATNGATHRTNGAAAAMSSSWASR